jgi:predicted PurR-regulated permease PerM
MTSMTDLASPRPETDDAAPRRSRINPSVELGAAYAWRILAIAALVVAVLWLTGQLLVVVIPLAVAALLTRALSPVASLLKDRGVKPGAAAAVSLISFLIMLSATIGLVGVAVAGEVDDLGPTLSEGVDDVVDWIVDDSPFDVSRSDIDGWRDRAGEALSSFVSSGEGSVLSGALLAGEVVIGALLSLIVTFFFLKDGRRMVTTALGAVGSGHRQQAERAADRGWTAAGGYLRGAAVLGVVEAGLIGLTLWIVGAGLVVPVMVVTFLAAFVPIVGAVAAGIVAVLVALVTAGTVPALVVAAVAIVVQQLDNDLLAPVIYGRALQLHPLVVLLGIAAGGSLFGLVGTFFAVPVLAVGLNAYDGFRHEHDNAPEPQPTT